MTGKKKSTDTKSIQQKLDELYANKDLSQDDDKKILRYDQHRLTLQGRKRKDQSARMSGDNNIMAGKVSPNRGKAMPQISEKIKGKKKPEGFGERVSKTRKALGLTNIWTGVERPEQSALMKDPSRNKGAQYMRETLTCSHCGKTANGPNYKRWHGDNCKLKSKNAKSKTPKKIK